MIKIQQALILLGALTLAGCAGMTTDDKYSTSYVESHITEGKTTQADVQRLYGVPDSNEKSSNGTTWVYRKGGTLSDVSSLVGYIPGAGSVSSALAMGRSTSAAVSSVNKVAGKANGNTEIHGDRFYVTFTNKGIVDYWSLE